MDIKSISPVQAPKIGATNTQRVDEKQPAAENQVRERRDTLELSGQAQEIRDDQRVEVLQEVQSQINSGFFNRPEIIKETASRIARVVTRK